MVAASNFVCYNVVTVGRVQTYPSNKMHIYRKLPAAKPVSQHINVTPVFMPPPLPKTLALPLLFALFHAWRPDERSQPTSDLQRAERRDLRSGGALAGQNRLSQDIPAGHSGAPPPRIG